MGPLRARQIHASIPISCSPTPPLPLVLPREHEHQSCALFDHICEHYQIDLSPDEQQRVKDLIVGDRDAAKVGREFQARVVSASEAACVLCCWAHA